MSPAKFSEGKLLDNIESNRHSIGHRDDEDTLFIENGVFETAGMKLLSNVVWFEGMYLGPHHFQAQNRAFEDLVHFSASNLWFEPYGIVGQELDAEALRNGTVALVHTRGLFPDGLAFNMPENDPLPPARGIGDLFPCYENR